MIFEDISEILDIENPGPTNALKIRLWAALSKMSSWQESRGCIFPARMDPINLEEFFQTPGGILQPSFRGFHGEITTVSLG
jgi:hypothetical protein